MKIQSFFHLCVVTVTVPLPSRYRPVTSPLPFFASVHQRYWSFINVTDRYLNVTHRSSTLPQRSSTLPNVTQRSSTLPNVTQRDLNVTHRYPPLLNVIWTLPTVTHRYPPLLNVTWTWPERDLNVTWTWPQCYLRGTFWKNRPLSQIFIFKKNFFPQNIISHAKLR